MNFSPFGGHFPTAIPTIHQFAAKFSSQEAAAGALCPQDNSSNRYTANGVPSFTQHHPATQQQMINTSKYQSSYINQNIYTGHQAIRQENKRPSYEQQELAQELCAAMLQQNQQQDKQQTNDGKHSKESQENERRNHQQQQQQQHQQHQVQQPNVQTHTATTSMPSTWQSLAAPGSTVADYLSHLPASTLPLSLHHFLKYSAENIKKETAAAVAANQHSIQGHTSLQEANLNLLHHNNTLNGLGGPAHALHPNGNPPNNPINPLSTLSTINTAQIHGGAPLKKKKKKKQEKEKKPRPKPGEIRLTTALDGSTLYCCPECHMAYPEKELLEQHLVGHTLERRFVCDICGAGLKRKDHLTRHKQSHNPERPYVCTVCLKAFKRKEQLTLHFVIHSGEKRHVCTECGKGFYRKDHLRKHTRSHIARRVKAELSQQTLQLPVAPSSSTNATQGILS